MHSMLVKLGKRVRELRMQAGFSQESFADYCSLHRTYMGRVERGEQNISLLVIEKIAKGLKISISDLFKGL